MTNNSPEGLNEPFLSCGSQKLYPIHKSHILGILPKFLVEKKEEKPFVASVH